MGRIDVAIDVGFDHAVHGDQAEAADDFRMVADFLRPEQDIVAIAAEVGIQLVEGRGLSEKAVAEAKDSLPDLISSSMPSWSTSVYAVRSRSGFHSARRAPRWQYCRRRTAWAAGRRADGLFSLHAQGIR